MLDIPGSKHDNGVEVIMYPKNSPPSDNQLWQLDRQPDGSYIIASKLHGKVLDCGGQSQGTKLIMWDRHGGNNQRWKKEGNYLVSMGGLTLDISGNNANLIIWIKNHPQSKNQHFDFEKAVR